MLGNLFSRPFAHRQFTGQAVDSPQNTTLFIGDSNLYHLDTILRPPPTCLSQSSVTVSLFGTP